MCEVFVKKGAVAVKTKTAHLAMQPKPRNGLLVTPPTELEDMRSLAGRLRVAPPPAPAGQWGVSRGPLQRL